MILGIYCSGGFGKEIYDVALRSNSNKNYWEKIIFIDDTKVNGSTCYLSNVYTFDEISRTIERDNIEIIIACGEPEPRNKIKTKVLDSGFELGRLIDPSAIISPTAIIEKGVIITSDCIVASSAYIGVNTAINVKTIVGHDVELSNDIVLSSMVNIGGFCIVGERTFIGMGSLVKEKISIGKEVIISMGSCIFSEVSDGLVVFCNPARPMLRNTTNKIF